MAAPQSLGYLEGGDQRWATRTGTGLGSTSNSRTIAILKSHALANASILGFPKGRVLASHPPVRKFLNPLLNPLPMAKASSWDLSLVLQVLYKPSFEPMAMCLIRLLSIKIVFLIAIITARRLPELAALSIARDLCTFQKDSIVPKTDPQSSICLRKWCFLLCAPSWYTVKNMNGTV